MPKRSRAGLREGLLCAASFATLREDDFRAEKRLNKKVLRAAERVDCFSGRCLPRTS
jgi:hypothetical protein